MCIIKYVIKKRDKFTIDVTGKKVKEDGSFDWSRSEKDLYDFFWAVCNYDKVKPYSEVIAGIKKNTDLVEERIKEFL